jgi:hypothetical protein
LKRSEKSLADMVAHTKAAQEESCNLRLKLQKMGVDMSQLQQELLKSQQSNQDLKNEKRELEQQTDELDNLYRSLTATEEALNQSLEEVEEEKVLLQGDLEEQGQQHAEGEQRLREDLVDMESELVALRVQLNDVRNKHHTYTHDKVLHVLLERAEGLVEKQMFYAQDPYVVVQVQNCPPSKQTQYVTGGGTDPVWDGALDNHLTWVISDTLLQDGLLLCDFEVRNQNTAVDDLIGKAQISLSAEELDPAQATEKITKEIALDTGGTLMAHIFVAEEERVQKSTAASTDEGGVLGTVLRRVSTAILGADASEGEMA